MIQNLNWLSAKADFIDYFDWNIYFILFWECEWRVTEETDFITPAENKMN